MFSKEVNIFNVRRPAQSCRTETELHTIANCLGEAMTYINEANSTDDCVEQIKQLAAGFVGSEVRERGLAPPQRDRQTAR